MVDIIKNKRKILIITASVVLLIFIIIVLKYYVFSSKEGGGLNLFSVLKRTETINIEKREFKNIDIEIFSSDKYKELKLHKVKHSNIKDIKIGKENPFEPSN